MFIEDKNGAQGKGANYSLAVPVENPLIIIIIRDEINGGKIAALRYGKNKNSSFDDKRDFIAIHRNASLQWNAPAYLYIAPINKMC